MNVFTTLWDKIKAIFSGAVSAVEVEFTKDEQTLLTLVQPLLAAAEASSLQDLITFITGVLSQAKAGADLATLESAVMNALEAVGSELLTLAKGLGSNLLQALIGLILSRLSTVTVATAALAPAVEALPPAEG